MSFDQTLWSTCCLGGEKKIKKIKSLLYSDQKNKSSLKRHGTHLLSSSLSAGLLVLKGTSHKKQWNVYPLHRRGAGCVGDG